MAGAGDLKEDLLLPLEQDLAVVRAPRKEHQPVKLDELLVAQTSALRCHVRLANRLGHVGKCTLF